MPTAVAERLDAMHAARARSPKGRVAVVDAAARKQLRFFKTPLEFGKMNHSYHAFVHCEQECRHVRGKGFDKIRLENGKLFVDEIPIVEPHFGTDSVSWNQQAPDHFSRGRLYFARNGLEAHGTIHLGATEQDALAHHVVATRLPLFAAAADNDTSAYVSSITKVAYPPGSLKDPYGLPDREWQAGLVLKLVTNDEMQTRVLLGDQDISDYVAWSADKTGNLVMSFDVGGDAFLYCADASATFYVTGNLVFDDTKAEPTFQGTVSVTCKNETGDDVYYWKGKADPKQVAAIKEPAKARLARPAAMPRAVAMAAALNIDNLLAIAPDDSVANQAQGLIVENMKWAIAQHADEKAWLAEFFGQTAPPLPSERQTLVNKSLAWYQQEFAKSYLGKQINGYDGPNSPTVRLTPAQALKLDNFMQHGLGLDSNLTIQQNGVYLEAFRLAKPELEPFLADAAQWAQTLYDTITDKDHFKQLYLLFKTAHDMTLANRYSTLLSVLQPSGELARAFNQKLMKGTLAITTLDVSFEDPLIVMQWLPAWLQKWLGEVSIDSSKLPSGSEVIAQQLKELQEIMDGDMIKVAEECASFLANAVGSNLLAKSQQAAEAFNAKYPKLNSFGNMFFYMSFGLAVTMVVQAFMNWDKLTDEQKARAITSTVGLGFEALKIVPDMITGFKNGITSGYNKLKDWLNDSAPHDAIDEIASAMDDEKWIVRFDLDTVTKVESSLWPKICSAALKVVAIVGVVVAAAFAVLSTIDFVNDIQTNQPITKLALDGIMMAANIASTICLALSLVVASTVFAIAAAVLAVIGLIAAIVAMFVVKPLNPLDEFMSNVIIPFVDGLDPKYATA